VNQLTADSPPFFDQFLHSLAIVLNPCYKYLSGETKMKHFFTVWFLMFCLGWVGITFGQSVNFEDGFEDGDFTNTPAWNGDADQFTVIGTDPNYLLQLQGDDENGDVSYLSTASTNVEGSWEFFIDLGFNPSNSNRADIFLMSDIADLEGSINGYAVRAGENLTDDVFHIVRYENGSEVATVLSGTTDISSGGAFRVKVTRTTGGDWTMEIAENYDGVLEQEGGTQTDNTFTSANYFGVRASYTSSNAENFTFDFKIDLPPFSVVKSTAVDDKVNITFNRPYDQSTVETGDFTIDNGLGSPASVTFTDATTVALNYNSTISSDRYTLTVNGIDDQNGNTIDNKTTSSFVIFGAYSDGDVIINEFVYDPPGTFGEEYLELKNTTSKYLNLQDWNIEDDGNSTNISSGIITLEPDSFIVVSQDTAALFGVFGNRAYLQASIPALNNGGDIIKVVTKAGTMADSLTYSNDWGGSNIALERRSAETASTFKENWGNSPHPDSGTPGLPNEVNQDGTPPQLTNLHINDSQTIQLTFNERLEGSTASDVGNLILTGNTAVGSASFLPPDSIELSLTDPLQNAEKYTLSVDGIEDIFSNTITNSDTTFTYYKISSADSGDVFINEFSYDPPDGTTEYIELYNPTSNSFDLQGWTINDNTGILRTITSSQYILPSDSIVVVAPDNTLKNNFPDIPLITPNSFNALNNGGDDIVLRNGSGELLDSLQYTSDWGGNELALERRTVSVAGTYQENWGDAPNGFGTPGTANEITADETPPAFEELKIEDTTTLKLIFSKNIESSSATDSQNYQITPAHGIQLISVQNDSVTLFLDEELTSGETYEVTVSNISDIFGNILSNATKEVEYLRIDQAQPGDLVINEILYNPGSVGADFVELYNVSDKNFDLKNWVIGDSSGETSITQDIQLQSKSYLVLTGSRTLARKNEKTIDIDGFPALNNHTPDDIFLLTDNNRTIDSLRYHQNWGGSADGTSLERKDPQAASNDASNWQTSNAESGNSAGVQNISFQEDTNPPEVIFSKILSDGDIEVQFSEFVKLTNDVQFLSNNQPLQVIRFDSTNANTVTLTSLPSKNNAENNTTITVQNLSDIKGNTTSSSKVPLSQPMEQSALVINEIMFNPLNDPDDNRPDQSEYIELRNTRDYAISLEGLVLHDAPDENGDLRKLFPVSSTAKWVAAQEQVLAHADEATMFEESHVANFFELEAANMRSVMRIDRSSLSLASSGDAIYIADSTGVTIDSVHYSEEWHNPNIIDTRGVALERVTPSGPSDDDSNWGSSVNEKGGTPNSENSIYQESTDRPQKIGISFTPNPFSPDNDGYEDNLFINYKLDHQDYMIDVRIYDRYGRIVRQVADGEQAGFEGQLIWDGRKDDGSRNRIGIYIVVFEAYNSISGGDQIFKETVVLARRLN
jgi:hypothetical protein